jgi:hypothetical protein
MVGERDVLSTPLLRGDRTENTQRSSEGVSFNTSLPRSAKNSRLLCYSCVCAVSSATVSPIMVAQFNTCGVEYSSY